MKRHDDNASLQPFKRFKSNTHGDDRNIIYDEDVSNVSQRIVHVAPTTIVTPYHNNDISDFFYVILQHAYRDLDIADLFHDRVFDLITTCKSMFMRMMTFSFLENYIRTCFAVEKKRNITSNSHKHSNLYSFFKANNNKYDIFSDTRRRLLKDIINEELCLYLTQPSYLPRWLFFSFNHTFFHKELQHDVLGRFESSRLIERVKNIYAFLTTYNLGDDKNDLLESRSIFVSGGYVSKKIQNMRWISDIDVYFKPSEWPNITTHTHVDMTCQTSKKILDLVPVLKNKEHNHVSTCMDNFDMNVVKCGVLYRKNIDDNTEIVDFYVSPMFLYSLWTKCIVVRLTLNNIDYRNMNRIEPKNVDDFFHNVKNNVSKFKNLFEHLGFYQASLQLKYLFDCFEKECNISTEKPSIKINPTNVEEASESHKNGITTLIHLFSKHVPYDEGL